MVYFMAITLTVAPLASWRALAVISWCCMQVGGYRPQFRPHPDAPCRQGAAVMPCRRLSDKNTIVRFPNWTLRIRTVYLSYDDFPPHGLRDRSRLAMNAQLEHGVGDPLGDRPRLNIVRSGDLFGGKALGD